VDKTTIGFGSHGTMNEPLGVPRGLAGPLFGFPTETQKVGYTERRKASLVSIPSLAGTVRVASVERRLILKQPDSGVVKRYQ
jgi:hypothetical protein